ncbi:MAG: trypsin-like serine peptidase [Thermoanaerobaculia bacterium]
MKRDVKKLHSAMWIVALLLVLAGAPALAQGHLVPFKAHAGVSSDGQIITPVKASRNLVEGFQGYAPTGPLADRFEETGAAVDRAEPVQEDAVDLAEILNLRPVNGLGEAKSIIGTDNRTLVSTTTSYPWRAIVLVTFTGGRCTGWLFGSDVVATAGHCVHTGGSSGTWMSNVRVYPGRNGSSSPYGSCTAKRLYSVLGWTASKDENYDYGAIKLNCTVGNTTGYFGFWWQSASLTGLSTTLAGYPGDKLLTQWKSTGTVAWTQDLQIYYPDDSVEGDSGAPVFQNRSGCGQCSMAIHGHGLHGFFPHSSYNHGVRISQPVFNNLVSWKNAS